MIFLNADLMKGSFYFPHKVERKGHLVLKLDQLSSVPMSRDNAGGPS